MTEQKKKTTDECQLSLKSTNVKILQVLASRIPQYMKRITNSDQVGLFEGWKSGDSLFEKINEIYRIDRLNRKIRWSYQLMHHKVWPTGHPARSPQSLPLPVVSPSPGLWICCCFIRFPAVKHPGRLPAWPRQHLNFPLLLPWIPDTREQGGSVTRGSEFMEASYLFTSHIWKVCTCDMIPRSAIPWKSDLS